MQVRTWMSSPAVHVSPDASIWDALQFMLEGSFRRLPVVEHDRLVGLVTRGHINKRIFLSMLPTAEPETPPAMTTAVSAIMVRDVVTVAPDTEITEATARMGKHGVSGLPVVEDGRLVGMLTVKDLFKALSVLERQSRQQALVLEQEVRSRTRHLEVLNAVGRAATRSLNTREVARDILEVFRDLFPFDRASMLLQEQDREDLMLFEVWTDSVLGVQQGPQVPLRGTMSGWVLEHGQPLLIGDLSQEAHKYPESTFFSEKGMRSAIVVPLGAHRQVFGTLNFGSRAPAAFTEKELKLAKQVARQVAQALHNVRQYQRTENLLEQLKEADRVKNEFMGIVSHDLRSPLASIHGYLQLFRDQKLGPLPEQYRELTHTIFDIIDYMVHLVDDLLDVGQMGARGLKLHPEPVAVDVFVRELVAALEAQAGHHQVHLAGEAPAGLVVTADPQRLRQMLTNLITNGIKFNKVGGEVSVRAETDGDAVVFVVQDTGIGIAEKDLPSLFELFSRLEGKKRTDGTGLGLFITRQLADLHGGTITVESTPGTGSSFRLRLPAHAEKAPAAEARVAS